MKVAGLRPVWARTGLGQRRRRASDVYRARQESFLPGTMLLVGVDLLVGCHSRAECGLQETDFSGIYPLKTPLELYANGRSGWGLLGRT